MHTLCGGGGAHVAFDRPSVDRQPASPTIPHGISHGINSTTSLALYHPSSRPPPLHVDHVDLQSWSVVLPP